MSNNRKQTMDEIDELYRDLDAHVSVQEVSSSQISGGADPTASLSVPTSGRMKHAVTNADFNGEPNRKDLDVSDRGSTLLGQNGRFDSHNILRTDVSFHVFTECLKITVLRKHLRYLPLSYSSLNLSAVKAIEQWPKYLLEGTENCFKH